MIYVMFLIALISNNIYSSSYPQQKSSAFRNVKICPYVGASRQEDFDAMHKALLQDTTGFFHDITKHADYPSITLHLVNSERAYKHYVALFNHHIKKPADQREAAARQLFLARLTRQPSSSSDDSNISDGVRK